MEPLQGGPMLYTFEGRNGMLGLINQDGKLVAKPQFDFYSQYVYNDTEQTRVIGLIAARRNSDNFIFYTYYNLDGTAKKLGCEGTWWHDFWALPGGRYAVVNSATSMIEFRYGLFDLEANAYIVEPEDGQWIDLSKNAFAVGQQCTIFETGQQITLPAGLGELQDYEPETQWFCFQKDGVFRWYDASFKHLPQFDDWHILPFKGKYAPMYIDYYSYSVRTAWTDRDGSIVLEKEGFALENVWEKGLYCFELYSYNGGSHERNERTPTLLDPDLNPVFTGEPGDRLWTFDGPIKGYMLLDKNLQVKASCDAYGKPLPVSDTAYILHTRYRYLCFTLKDGVWRATPDLSAYRILLEQDYYHDGYVGSYYEAKIVDAYEDHVLIAGWQNRALEKQTEVPQRTIFAIDWEGSLYPDCPLEPFYDSIVIDEGEYPPLDPGYYWRTAGEQGPNYFWVELGGQRGYIDTAGNWLFIAEN